MERAPLRSERFVKAQAKIKARRAAVVIDAGFYSGEMETLLEQAVSAGYVISGDPTNGFGAFLYPPRYEPDWDKR